MWRLRNYGSFLNHGFRWMRLHWVSVFSVYCDFQENLKIPNGYPEAVNKRTENILAKRKGTNWRYTENWRPNPTNPTKNGGKLRGPGRVGSSGSTYDIHRVTLITSTVVSHKWGKDQIMITTSGTYPWLFVTQIFCDFRNSASFIIFLYDWSTCYILLAVNNLLGKLEGIVKSSVLDIYIDIDVKDNRRK